MDCSNGSSHHRHRNGVNLDRRRSERRPSLPHSNDCVFVCPPNWDVPRPIRTTAAAATAGQVASVAGERPSTTGLTARWAKPTANPKKV